MAAIVSQPVLPAAKLKLKSSTLRFYADHLKNHVLPIVGAVPLRATGEGLLAAPPASDGDPSLEVMAAFERSEKVTNAAPAGADPSRRTTRL